MWGDKDATATVAVKDIKLAGKSYERVLRLKEVRFEETGVPSYKSGSSRIRIYDSELASTNRAAPVSWAVGDEIDGMLQALQSF